MEGKVKILQPEVNLSTVLDGRGLIASYVPKDNITEFVYQITHPGKSRGHHFHPEFDEYTLFIEGEGIYVEKLDDGTERYLTISPGICLYAPAGVYHTWHTITMVKSISLLTKPWNKCIDPILPKSIN
jgi:mannose-6-phosphate isomerase-like protein (cupin superfamily)